MIHLEDEIDTLSELDSLRVNSAVLREEGRLALCSLPAGEWESARDDVQDALVVKALSGWRGRQAPPNLAAQLDGLLGRLQQRGLAEIFEEEPDKVPVLRAARILQALVAAPYCAFSKTALFCYYRIVRELYTADAPDWMIGGARAGASGVASAFITGECMRAIAGFARTLERTGDFVGSLREIAGQSECVSSASVPPAWREAEDRRLSLDFYTRIQRLAGDVALPLESGELSDPRPDAVRQYCQTVRAGLLAALDRSRGLFAEVKSDIDAFRRAEEARSEGLPRDSADRAAQVTRFERAASGHLIALSAVEQAIDQAKRAFGILRDRGLGAEPLGELEKLFAEAARDVRKLLHPPRHFIATVLDRELAAASAENIAWDPSEMVFAAASYGAVKSWDDERLSRAGRHLAKAISERGRFPVGRPIHSLSRGYKLNVLGGEVLRAFAQLLQHVPAVEVEPQLVRRMMLFFEDRRVTGAKRMSAWYHEAPQQPVLPDRSVTAVAVLALSRINRMLDERINAGAFRHFSVRTPRELRKGPDLQRLFYGDYGLCQAPETVRRQESVAIALERMRAHVAGVPLPRTLWSPLYSVVLHGPPGTGKTTLVEALAASCGVPLVEVTPSDIVVGGADAIERRTRAVFKALSLLTRAVIIFDEFDPVLTRRDAVLKNWSGVAMRPPLAGA